MSGAFCAARTLAELRARVHTWRASNERIALVPTMGALHEGHVSLIEAARRSASRVIVSIFVNPRQFAPHEDFSRYPRDEANDIATVADAGGHLVYAPVAAAVYPPGFATEIRLKGPAEGLESKARPHFFSGVATVVTKLLLQAEPDVAVFGEKDYQQLKVVQRLVADLSIPVGILPVPIARAADGLALSSRNVYLSAGERARAPLLSATLRAVAARLASGADAETACAEGARALVEGGFAGVDYLTLRDAETLEPLAQADRPGRLLAAARLGAVRLLDNWPVRPA
ncbi:MAG: pantoate--beta-alanine ligase [Alphaproteobacteria bacterium]|nr:pantoate--beta-alanine ligase [Alphaproteobacteria bacterium]